MRILSEIQKPISGLLLSTSGLVISLQDINEIAQCTAALLAIAVGVVTFRLTLLKIKNERNKANQDENNL